MALTKTPVNINFQKGLNTKNDPYQIPVGEFLAMNNSVFDTVGRITKRPGYPLLSTPNNGSALCVTTFKDSLTAIGGGVAGLFSSYYPSIGFTNSAPYFPVDVSTTSLIRNTQTQIQTDSTTATNGLVCTVYTSTVDSQNFTYKYSVHDPSNGQILISPTTIPSATGTPRVFYNSGCFVVVYSTSVPSLKAFGINSGTLLVSSPVTVTTNYAGASSVAWDGAGTILAGPGANIVVAWNGASSSGMWAVLVGVTISVGVPVLTVFSPVNIDASHTATVVGVWLDGPGTIWVAYYSSSSTNGYITSLVPPLLTTSTGSFPAQFISGVSGVYNITGAVANSACTVIYEAANNWSYDTSIPNSDVIYTPISSVGVVGSPWTQRSMGLASKAFVVNLTLYVTLCYGTQYQPTYFVVHPNNISGGSASLCIAKLAYQNGGGFLKTGLPSISVIGEEAQFSYLFKDFIEAVNKNTNLPSGTSIGIYAQTGINLATITLNNTDILPVEAGLNLNVSGGFLWGYDGSQATENNFFLWPELDLNADGTYHGISATTSSVTPAGNVTSGSNIITALSDPTSVLIGMKITGSGIVSSPVTTVVGFTASGDLIISLPANGTHSATTLTIVGNAPNEVLYYQFIYQWVDNQGNVFNSAPSIPVTIDTTSTGSNAVVTIKVPNLPLTYKAPTTATTPPKIIGYRWSANQQVYYQFTSLEFPTFNVIGTQTTTFIDASSNATILGNPILYTTGGVIENINPPATNLMTLFDDRLWLVDSEDRNLLWFSKQIIESTPVEMSDLLTFFVAPTISGRGSTGEMSAVSGMDDKLIIFKNKGAIYYINGAGPDNTGSNNQYSQPIFITTPVTCTNQFSITLIPSGLMFQAADSNGIWLLGRDLQVQYIGAPVQAYNSATVTSATTIPGTTQVRFTLDSGITLMYDYFVEQWDTFSNTADGSHAISSTIYNDQHTVLSASNNRVFQQTPSTYLDGASPVLLSFTTSWINIAGLRGYERAYFFFLLGTYLSPHTLTVGIAYDYDSTIVQTSTFTPVSTTDIENFRFFFERQKCKAFQITITESLPNGASAGAGLTISGLNVIAGFKKGYAPISAAKSIG